MGSADGDRVGLFVARLGTAFQIVDDRTDFEFDPGRLSHSLLVARIRHRGGPEERRAPSELWKGAPPRREMLEGLFRTSARPVRERAFAEARAAFSGLASLGFWFREELAEEVVHAVVGLEGVSRMEALAPGE